MLTRLVRFIPLCLVLCIVIPGISGSSCSNPDEELPGLEAAVPESSESTPWPMLGHDRMHSGSSWYRGPTTPTIKWTIQLPSTMGGGPAIDRDGNIIVGTGNSGIICYRPDGSIKWNYLEDSNYTLGVPAIARDGTIYFLDNTDRPLRALNPDGTLKWAFTAIGGTWYGSPVIGNGDTVYFGAADGCLYSVRPDGMMNWRYCTDYDIVTTPAIGRDGTIYLTGLDYHLHAIGADGKLKWMYQTENQFHSNPAIGHNGTIYCYDSRFLYAISPTGNLLWKRYYYSDGETSPSIAPDGSVVIIAGLLRIFTPEGEIKWEFPAGSAYGTPVIDKDGTIYIGAFGRCGVNHESFSFAAISSMGICTWGLLTSQFGGGIPAFYPAIDASGTIYIGNTNDNKLIAIQDVTTTPAIGSLPSLILVVLVSGVISIPCHVRRSFAGVAEKSEKNNPMSL